MLPVLKYNGVEIAKNIDFARTAICQMLGLMFWRNIPQDFAMIFILEKPSLVNVHMLFVFFPIDVIFLDKEKRIAGLVKLKPWTGYKSMRNIKYVIETNPGTIMRYDLTIGGTMEFEES